jgi:hypothetical protein
MTKKLSIGMGLGLGLEVSDSGSFTSVNPLITQTENPGENTKWAVL